MDDPRQRKVFPLDGMHCAGCEARVERILAKVEGVRSVRADLATESVAVGYVGGEATERRMRAALERAGYYPGTAMAAESGGSVLDAPAHDEAPRATAAKPAATSRASQEAWKAQRAGRPAPANRMSALQAAGLLVAVLAVVLIVQAVGGFDYLPEVSSTLGIGMLFVVGLLTSVHCVAMCGGIVLSQCLPGADADGAPTGASASRASGSGASAADRRAAAAATLRPGLLYNAGRVVAYTAVGAVVGAIGSAISFTGWARGVVAVVAGAVMLLMGVRMIGILPGLARFLPRPPRFLRAKADAAAKGRGPFLVGLLNGLMPCGPLQAMQAYALGTGSALLGAVSMFMFSLGTVPLMLGLGAAGAALGRRFTDRMARVGAVLVLALGIVMVGRGLSLSGFAPAAGGGATKPTGAVSVVQDGIQTVTTTLSSSGYPEFTVQAGVPVRWDLKATAATLTGCNRTVVVPAYGIERTLSPGDNWIEFTPTASGTVPFSCWMGMIRSRIHVVDALPG